MSACNGLNSGLVEPEAQIYSPSGERRGHGRSNRLALVFRPIHLQVSLWVLSDNERGGAHEGQLETNEKSG